MLLTFLMKMSFLKILMKTHSHLNVEEFDFMQWHLVHWQWHA